MQLVDRCYNRKWLKLWSVEELNTLLSLVLTHALSAGSDSGQVLVWVLLVPAGARGPRHAATHPRVSPDLTGQAHLSQMVELSTWRLANLEQRIKEEKCKPLKKSCSPWDGYDQGDCTCAASYRSWSGGGWRVLILPPVGVNWLLHLVSSRNIPSWTKALPV